MRFSLGVTTDICYETWSPGEWLGGEFEVSEIQIETPESGRGRATVGVVEGVGSGQEESWSVAIPRHGNWGRTPPGEKAGAMKSTGGLGGRRSALFCEGEASSMTQQLQHRERSDLFAPARGVSFPRLALQYKPNRSTSLPILSPQLRGDLSPIRYDTTSGMRVHSNFPGQFPLANRPGFGSASRPRIICARSGSGFGLRR